MEMKEVESLVKGLGEKNVRLINKSRNQLASQIKSAYCLCYKRPTEESLCVLKSFIRTFRTNPFLDCAVKIKKSPFGDSFFLSLNRRKYKKTLKYYIIMRTSKR